MKPGMGVLKALGLTTLLVCGTQTAFAQDYPARNITVVVPFAAGGPTDTLARILTDRLQVHLKQSVVIENNGAAAGSVGLGRVARHRRPALAAQLLHHFAVVRCEGE